MDPTLEIELVLPMQDGLAALGDTSLILALEDVGLRLRPEANEDTAPGTQSDLSAIAVAVAGSVVGAAAVRGAFELLQTIISEACESKRQRRGHAHELELSRISVNGKSVNIDLNDKDAATAQLRELLRLHEDTWD